VKVFPVTAMAVWRVRLLLASVTQGVTWVTVVEVEKLKAWLVAEVLLLMATITRVVGAELLFLKAEMETPAVGTSVAPIR
jgi:hypothetical protein